MSFSIWSTVEVDAWSRDFSYEEYLDIHTKSKCLGSPLSFDTYQAIHEIMDTEYEDSFK